MMSWSIPVMLRQCGWSGFWLPSASHHFHPLFCLFRPYWRKRIKCVGQETTKYKAGTLPLNMYQTAVHWGERRFAPVERVEQLEVSKEEGREGAPTSRDPGGGGW